MLFLNPSLHHTRWSLACWVKPSQWQTPFIQLRIVRVPLNFSKLDLGLWRTASPSSLDNIWMPPPDGSDHCKSTCLLKEKGRTAMFELLPSPPKVAKPTEIGKADKPNNSQNNASVVEISCQNPTLAASNSDKAKSHARRYLEYHIIGLPGLEEQHRCMQQTVWRVTQLPALERGKAQKNREEGDTR